MSRQRPVGRRRAKKAACGVAAKLLENYLGVGQPYVDCDDESKGWIPADADALLEAMEELIVELERRSVGKTEVRTGE